MAGVGAIEYGETKLIEGGTARELADMRITPNLLPLLGLQPELGRGFLPDEAQAGRDGEALIGDQLWRRDFGGRRGVLGQPLRLDDRIYTIVGVLPAHPGPAFDPTEQVFTPLDFSAEELAKPGLGPLETFGRVQPGLSWRQEKPRVEAYAKSLGWRWGQSPVTLVALDADMVWKASPGRTLLFALLGAVGLLLLIACANVAGLLLARSLGREQEMAVRRALGARRGQIVRQLLTEGALLAAAAAGLGILLADWGTHALRASPLDYTLERLSTARLDPAVLGFAAAAAVVCVLLCSLAPALRLGSPRTGRQRQRARNLFLAVEVALTMVLLVGAGLLVNSLIRLSSQATGLDVAHLAQVKFELTPQQLRQPQQVEAMAQRALAAVRHRPGWRSVALADWPPGDNNAARTYYITPNPQLEVTSQHDVGLGYFTTVGQGLLLGRDFNEHDTATAPGVVIVNEAWVRRFSRSGSPLGMELRWAHPSKNMPADYRVIGVAADARDEAGVDGSADAELYLDWAQSAPDAVALVANAADPGSAAASLRRILARAVPEAPVSEAGTVASLYSGDIAYPRFRALAVSGFAGMALLFALAGIWAQVAFAVEQRRREFGIRLALGAPPRHILGTALRQMAWLTAAGLGAGLLGAWAVARLLRSFLFQVQPADPATFAAITVLFALAALAAGVLPARRALRVDPASALRCE